MPPWAGPGSSSATRGGLAAALRTSKAHGRRRQTERARRPAWRSRGAAAARPAAAPAPGAPRARGDSGERLGPLRDPPAPLAPGPRTLGRVFRSAPRCPAVHKGSCGGLMGRTETPGPPHPLCSGG